MKLFKTLIIGALLLISVGKLAAQEKTRMSGPPKNNKIFSDTHVANFEELINDELLKLDFDLPFSGVVEFKLQDTKGHLLWENFYDDPSGHNHITLRLSKLKAGAYHYDMVFKGNHYQNDFVIH